MFSRVSLKFTTALFIFATIMLTACEEDGGSSTATPTATLTGISITPATASVAKGQNTLFTATAHYSDGSSANITSQATWSSTDTTVATINSTTGVATGHAVGTASINASFNGVGSTAIPLTVTAAMVTDITVSATSYSVPKGAAVTFSAMATYSDGTSGDVSGSVTWSSSDTTVASLNGSGIASTLAEGNSEISASGYNLTSNTVILTVTAPALLSIALNPTNACITKGLSTYFTATGSYTDGTNADITPKVIWYSNDNTIAVFGASSNAISVKAYGIAEGTTTVYATLGNVTSSTALLKVTTAVITGLSISPTTPSVVKGVPTTFTATGNYSDGSSCDISGSVIWSSSVPSVATLNLSGVASTLAEGSTTISATGYSLTSNSALLTVTP